MTPKISIVVPSYNSVRFIEKTLQSIVTQNYPNTECIVVDGGSDDGTLEVLKKYSDYIRWISEKDKGQSDAINKGLKLSTGDIVTYLCADDIYENDCLSKVADFFEKNKNKWVYGRCRIVDENNVEIRKPINSYRNFWQRRYCYASLLVMDFLSQPAVFWRRELIDEVGTFNIDLHLAMEYDYWLRIGARYKPGYLNEWLARFRLHPVSKSSTRFAEAAREARDVARKHAVAQKKGYLVPLQYANCCLVISTYSILNSIFSRKTI